MTAPGHQHFIDWLKAAGMLLILVGHAIGGTDVLFNSVSQPIYSKQLGVAFFVFVAGWGLSSARRPRIREVYNRAFALYFYGLVCALLLSAAYALAGRDINESNYLPLLAGANVFLNYFPANPTTWYIGMYLHLLLVWWLVGPRRVTAVQVLLVTLAEIAVRGLWLGLDRPFTAYMMVTNWLGIFALGMHLGTRGDTPSVARGWLWLSAWLLLLAAWRFLPVPLQLDDSFPLRRNRALPGDAWVVSCLVSAVYLVNTLLAFQVFRCWRSNALVRVISRNTLLIFILHMPLYYAANPVLRPLDSLWLRKSALVVGSLLLLCLLSELVNRVVPLPALRERIAGMLRLPSARGPGAGPAASV